MKRLKIWACALENNDLENDEAPAVRLVNQILEAGVQMKASDIHIDPQEA